MPSFICHKCGCIDNTACGGTYWMVLGKSCDSYADDWYNKNPVCCACAPKKYIDGSGSEDAGQWHNRFTRDHWTDLFKDLHELSLAQSGRTGDFVNTKIYVKQVKKGRLGESLVKNY